MTENGNGEHRPAVWDAVWLTVLVLGLTVLFAWLAGAF